MTEIEIHAVNALQSACRGDEDIAATAVGLANWLCVAATPTFAIMALLAGLDESPMVKLCSAGPGAPLSGMVSMYLFMSVFHSPPWLKLISSRRNGARRA
jgi:hypothetical protein